MDNIQHRLSGKEGGPNMASYTPLIIFIALFISILLIYVFMIWVVPFIKFKFKRRYIWLAVFVFWILPQYISLFAYGVYEGFSRGGSMFHDFSQILSAMYGLQLTFLGFFYFLDIYDKQRSLQDYQEILQKRLEAESKFLSSQVNPHFLFNTINNIYSLTIHNPKEAKMAVNMMESLISYIHNDSQEEWIDLAAEIAFLKSYLNLELLRNHEQNVRLIFEVDGSLENKKIAPLIIVNFIENAFKHGIKGNLEKSYVVLRIDAYEHNTVFVIRNKKAKLQQNDMNKAVGGIGLKNVKRRLELIYQDDYSLKIKDKKDYFEVKLTLGNNKW